MCVCMCVYVCVFIFENHLMKLKKWNKFIMEYNV